MLSPQMEDRLKSEGFILACKMIVVERLNRNAFIVDFEEIDVRGLQVIRSSLFDAFANFFGLKRWGEDEFVF